MLQFSIDVPKPSRFVSHPKVDEIANHIREAFEQAADLNTDQLDVQYFLKEALDREVVWEKIEEPAGRSCLASINRDRVTVNKNYRTLFHSKPFVLRSCLSHEIGHDILRHLEAIEENPNQSSLFDSSPSLEIAFHDSSWHGFGLTHEEFSQLRTELALESFDNPESREALRALDNKMEPEWMYYQAEQFASCFLVPKNRLFRHIENGVDITNWNSLYWLRDQFNVSISMITVRLQKLKLITINGKQIQKIPEVAQSRLC